MATVRTIRKLICALAVAIVVSFAGTELLAQRPHNTPMRDRIDHIHQTNPGGLYSEGQGYDGSGINPGGMYSGGQGYNPASHGGQGYNPANPGGQGYNPANPGGMYSPYGTPYSGSEHRGLYTEPGHGYDRSGVNPYGMYPDNGYGYDRSGSGPGSLYSGQSYDRHGHPNTSQNYAPALQNYAAPGGNPYSAQPWDMHRHWSEFHVPGSAGQLYQMNNYEIRPRPTCGNR